MQRVADTAARIERVSVGGPGGGATGGDGLQILLNTAAEWWIQINGQASGGTNLYSWVTVRRVYGPPDDWEVDSDGPSGHYSAQPAREVSGNTTVPLLSVHRAWLGDDGVSVEFTAKSAPVSVKGGTTAIASFAASTIDFDPTYTTITESPTGEANVALQVASATKGGVLTNTTQTVAGKKTIVADDNVLTVTDTADTTAGLTLDHDTAGPKATLVNTLAGVNTLTATDGTDSVKLVQIPGDQEAYLAGTDGDPILLVKAGRGVIVGDVLSGGPHLPSSGGQVVAMRAGSDPGGVSPTTAGTYAKDVDGTVELFGFNGAGEVYQLTPPGAGITVVNGPYYQNQYTSTTWTTNINNWTLPADNVRLRIASDAHYRTIGGIAPGTTPAGRLVCLHNVGEYVILILNEDGSSAAGNRILTTTSNVYFLAPNHEVTLVYDNVNTAWRISENSDERLEGVATYGTTSAHINDWDIDRDRAQHRLFLDGDYDLTGIAGGQPGLRHRLINVSGSAVLTIKHESADSAAANRFALPFSADVRVPPCADVLCDYDGSTQRWRVVGSMAWSSDIRRDGPGVLKVVREADAARPEMALRRARDGGAGVTGGEDMAFSGRAVVGSTEETLGEYRIEYAGSGSDVSSKLKLITKNAGTGNTALEATSAGRLKLGGATTGNRLVGTNGDGETTSVAIGDGLTLDTGTYTLNADAGVQYLDDLLDVTITTPANGEVLTYNSSGSAWINAKVYLAQLGDVNVSVPSNGQVLTWNTSAAKWVAASVSSGASYLDDLLDVTLTSPAHYDFLYYNGTAWVNTKGYLNYLFDVNTPSPGDGDVLTWDNTASEWIASTPSAGVQYLDELIDVVLSTPPASGNLLLYNGTNWIDWEPDWPTGLDDLTDVTLSGAPDPYDFLYYSGTAWTNTPLFLDYLYDVDVGGTLSDGAVLTFDSGAGKWVAGDGGDGGDTSGPSSSVDGEIALFDSTTGKLLKRATGSGGVEATSGVYSTYTLTAAGKALLDDASASDQRTTLGLGSLATLSSVTTTEIAAATLVTESEGIASNDNDTTLPTSAAVKAFVDAAVAAAIATILPPSTVANYLGATLPSGGWLDCDGALVSRTTYAALFAVIGTRYGVGDGSTTFALPDFRGRVLIGAGTGSGLTARVLGNYLGTETHTLTIAEMPSHTHGPTGAYDGIWQYESSAAGTIQGGSSYNATAQSATGATGGDGSHNNMQPSAVVRIIIKT